MPKTSDPAMLERALKLVVRGEIWVGHPVVGRLICHLAYLETQNGRHAMPKREPARLLVLTIGHSTRPLKDFIALLKAHRVKRLVDVRTIPRSRHNPQFNREALSAALHSARLHYRHMKAFGGLRHAHADSPNTGWRNASFRGFADHMQTPEFEAALETLIQLARQEQIAIMCAEAVPWRCHRSLIADALAARGIRVEDILSGTRRQKHRLTSFARVRGKRITYPPVNGEL